MNKTTIIATLFAVSVFAADASKPPTPASIQIVPAEKKLEIRTAQLLESRLSDSLGKLAMQYQATEKRLTEARAALAKLVNSIPKPKDCVECEFSDTDLVWQPAAKQAAQQ